MKNMGLSDLALVAPRGYRRAAAAAMAVHATDLLDAMTVCDTLADAVAAAGWVLGSTCRPGSYRRRARSPRDAAAEVVSVAARNQVAMVFGPEDHGLSNEDLKLCHDLITIPTHSGYPSLNVAQAALLCLYEVFLVRHPARPETTSLATSARSERMLERLRQSLLDIGFLHGANPDHIMFTLRRLFGRARLEEREVAILLGVAHQIEWFASGGREVAAERRRQGARLK